MRNAEMEKAGRTAGLEETLEQTDVKPLALRFLRLCDIASQGHPRRAERGERTGMTAGSCLWSPISAASCAPFISGRSETGWSE